jgi:Asp-tRNA(Asn)/Glu-tRNA(Gln) amidotransferase C subunit
MTDDRVNKETLRDTARAIGLDLPEDRLDTLKERLTRLLPAFDRLYAIDTSDRQPAVLVYDREEKR